MNSSPQYAVMLNGKWGAGKTWFMQDVIKDLEGQNLKFLHVSLYGLSSYDDIGDAIFRCLHPALSSKGALLTGTVVKGVLRNFKIDLKDIKLPDYLTKTEGHILVFDDLERCSMDPTSTLGYINQFVEHQGHKVIIIGNEEELLSEDKQEAASKDPYKRIKEKVIGKTFSIAPNPSQAIDLFLTELETNEVQSFCKLHLAHFIETYEASSYQNLRHLRQALLDFERFFKALPTEAQRVDELLLELLRIYLALTFEVKSGNILPEGIEKFRDEYIARLIRLDTGDEGHHSNYDRLSKKYGQITFHHPVIELATWKKIIGDGRIDVEAIKTSIEASHYFKDQESWKRLWFWHDLPDEEFEQIFKDVVNKFKSKEYEDIQIIIHIAGILLTLSDNNLIKEPKDEIIQTVKDLIAGLRKAKKLPTHNLFAEVFSRETSADGLAFQGKTLPEFNDLWNYTIEQLKLAAADTYSSIGNEILEKMTNEINSLYRLLLSSDATDTHYVNIPILAHIDPDKLVERFLCIPPENQRYICMILSERYKHDGYHQDLSPERSWLVEVVQRLETKVRNSPELGRLSRFRIERNFIPEFKRFIDSLPEGK